MTGSEALCRSGVCSLPVSVSTVAGAFGVKVVDYASFERSFSITRQELYDNASFSGFSMMVDGQFVCVLNTSLCHRARRRWTAAHELGHVLSGHISGERSFTTPEQEREANLFAAELLAPLTVLHFCGVSSAMEIERLCGISQQAAGYRFGELSQLRRRQENILRSGLGSLPVLSTDEIPVCSCPQSVFLSRDIDRELFMRFSPFISSYISRRSAHDGYERYLKEVRREPMAI